MNQYIALLTFTAQGAANIQDSTNRAHHFNKLAKKAGVKVTGQYWTMGCYDGVLILAADSEKKILHLLTQLAAAGNVQTKTMQAFTEKQFAEIAGR